MQVIEDTYSKYISIRAYSMLVILIDFAII